jgi:tetratricopeptide (TPR) repeat protein
MANILADYNRAQNWLERLVALIGEAGKDDLDLVFIPLTLASIYVNMEHYEKAEPLYKCSLGILEKSLGKDHPDVANTLNNLANLYREQGRYEEAEPLYQRAIAIMQAKFPNGHPNLDTFQANYDDLKKTMAEE